MSSSRQTLAQVRSCLERFALGSPKVQFQLVDGWSSKQVWEHQGCKSTREAFSRMFGPLVGAGLSDRCVSGHGIDIAALVSPPLANEMQSSSNMQFIFINGRAARNVIKLERLINKLYREFLDKEQDGGTKKLRQPIFPAYVLSIRCDSALYDILWEPTKSLVQFKDWTPLLDLVQRMLFQMFGPNASRDAASTARESDARQGEHRDSNSRSCNSNKNVDTDQRWEVVENHTNSLATPPPPLENEPSCDDMQQGDAFSALFFEPPQTPVCIEVTQPARQRKDASSSAAGNVATADGNCVWGEKDSWTAHNLKNGKPPPAHEDYKSYQKRMRFVEGVALTSESLKQASVIAQVGAKFILLKTGSQLLCVDQHAADERVRLESFERDLKLRLESGILSVQNLVANNTCALTLRQQITFVEAKHDLEQWGCYALPESDDSQSVVLYAVPAVFGVALGVDDFVSTLNYFSQVPSMLAHTVPPPIRQLIISRSCRGAIKFGDILSIGQCEKLIAELAKCDFPFQCAHGRPTCCPLVNIGSASSSSSSTKPIH
jgi:DNA mismatch repair ATPase MutL